MSSYYYVYNERQVGWYNRYRPTLINEKRYV